MPFPAAPSRQLPGARIDRVSPGWTTWLLGVWAPAAEPRPMTPTVATAAAAAARFIVLVSKVPSSLCVGETRPRTDETFGMTPAPAPGDTAVPTGAGPTTRRLPGSD